MNEAALHNYVGYEKLRKEILALPKYGNDIEDVDEMANDLYEYVAKIFVNVVLMKAWVII